MAPTLPDFARLSVAVAGDLVSDHYLYARPRKLSREAPVMVLRHAGEARGAGGAANVARNLRALGAEVRLFGAVGRDAQGRDLLRRLADEGIGIQGVATVPGWTTPEKTRVLAAEPRRSLQQVLRIDREPERAVDESVRADLARGVRGLAGEVDALVVSDYEYGAVDARLGAAVAELCRSGTPCVLDPRREIAAFTGLTALTPNVGELALLTGRAAERLDDPAELAAAARELRERAACAHLLVTRGNLGMALFGAELPEEGLAVEASGAGEVTDVSGAGDTSAAVFALALAAGLDAPGAMVLANAAAGVVVMENGAAVCRPSELAAALATTPVPARLARRGFA